MKKVLVRVAGLATLAAPLALFSGTAASAATPAQIGGGGPAPCFCIAEYDITKSQDCNCTLQIVDLSWLSSPNCALISSPPCPASSNKRCELNADFAETGAGCTGSWPDTVIRTRCESIKNLNLDCSGGGTHTVTLTCNPCTLI